MKDKKKKKEKSTTPETDSEQAKIVELQQRIAKAIQCQLPEGWTFFCTIFNGDRNLKRGGYIMFSAHEDRVEGLVESLPKRVREAAIRLPPV